MLWGCIRHHVRTHGKLFRSFTGVVRKGLSGSQTPLRTGITGVFKNSHCQVWKEDWGGRGPGGISLKNNLQAYWQSQASQQETAALVNCRPHPRAPSSSLSERQGTSSAPHGGGAFRKEHTHLIKPAKAQLRNTGNKKAPGRRQQALPAARAWREERRQQ